MQSNYNFLKNETGPRVIVEAMKLYGVQEIVGKQHNPTILGWADELGGNVKKVYTSDEIAWCGLFVGVVVSRADFEVVKDPLWARNWINFGTKQTTAMLGDVLIFTRPGGGGHVGFYVGEDKTCYHVLGGNQSNRVNVTRILKSRCVGIRRCSWKKAQPKQVRVIQLSATGEVSTNEA